MAHTATGRRDGVVIIERACIAAAAVTFVAATVVNLTSAFSVWWQLSVGILPAVAVGAAVAALATTETGHLTQAIRWSALGLASIVSTGFILLIQSAKALALAAEYAGNVGTDPVFSQAHWGAQANRSGWAVSPALVGFILFMLALGLLIERRGQKPTP